MDSMMPMDMRPQSVQKMMLSPGMLISSHVLQLNITDLESYLRLEMEENLLLEEESPKEDSDEELTELDEELTTLSEEINDGESFLNAPLEQPSVAVRQKRSYLESLVVKKESLYEHLLWQLNVLAEDEEQRRIGQFLIGNLDADGYLKVGLKEIQDALGESAGNIKSALTLIRSFDPTGVGARDLKEALLIQLIFRGKAKGYLYKIAYFHLENLANGKYKKIADNLKISVSQVKQAKLRISCLEPKPGRAFSIDEAFRVTPDVFLDKNNGAYSISVNEEGLPRLRISHYYVKILKNKTGDEKTKKFLRERFLSAKWLLNALKNRRLTIERVCAALVEEQRNFFELGEFGLKPLTLKDVANRLFISEATVSRVVSNKYLQTPQSIYSLKQFFPGGIRKSGRRPVSDAYIKKRIEELIKSEENNRPLSDSKLAELLKKEDIDISRRTVSKYRKKLKILPSYLRKL